jgi:hypothetical protein
MTTHWTTADIARELHLGSRAAARKWVQRHRDNGVRFDIVIDEKTSERYYADRLPLKKISKA